MSNGGQLIWAKGPPSSAGQAAPPHRRVLRPGGQDPAAPKPTARARAGPRPVAPRDPDGRLPPAGKMVGMYELITELLQAKAAVLSDVDLGSGRLSACWCGAT